MAYVYVCNSLQMGPHHPSTYKDHEPCATFRRCRCSCAIKQCHVQCSEMSQCPQRKKEEIKEKKPKTAPWLRTPEPPRTGRKRERRKEKKKWGGGETPWPQRKKGVSSTKRPHESPPTGPIVHGTPSQSRPGPTKVPKSQASAHSRTTLPKLPKTHPHPPPSPPPQPVGLGPRAHSEGTWPSTAGHHEASSPSSSVRYPA